MGENMGKPRIQVRKRRELHGDLNEAVGVDRASLAEMERMNAEFIASAKRMNIKPITLLFMTNQLREMVRKILFHQCLGPLPRGDRRADRGGDGDHLE